MQKILHAHCSPRSTKTRRASFIDRRHRSTAYSPLIRNRSAIGNVFYRVPAKPIARAASFRHLRGVRSERVPTHKHSGEKLPISVIRHACMKARFGARNKCPLNDRHGRSLAVKDTNRLFPLTTTSRPTARVRRQPRCMAGTGEFSDTLLPNSRSSHHARHDQQQGSALALPGIAIGARGGAGWCVPARQMRGAHHFGAHAIGDADVHKMLVRRQSPAAAHQFFQQRRGIMRRAADHRAGGDPVPERADTLGWRHVRV